MHDLPWSFIAVATSLGVAGGVAAAARPRLGLLLIATAIGIFAVRLLRLSLAELIVITMPLMFFPPVGFLLNVSVADFLMPILVLTTLTAGLHRTLTAGQREAARRYVTLSGLLLFVMMLSGLAAALRVPEFNLRGAALDTMKLIVVLVYFVTLLIVFMAMTERRRLRAARIWVWFAVVQSVGSLVGFVPSDGTRSLGYFQDPNLYAGYLLASIALLFFVVSRDRMTAWPLALLALIGGVLSTGSRGALAAAAVLLSLSTIALLSSRIGKLLMACGVGALVVLATVPDILAQSFLPGVDRLLTSADSAGTDPRWRLWRRAWELATDHPLLGVGIGQFPEYSAGLTPFRSWTEGQVAHNTFLSFAAEGGALGLLAFCAILLVAARHILGSQHLTRVHRMTLLLGVVVIAVMMMTLNLQNLRYVWAFLAFAVAAALSSDPPPDPENTPLPTTPRTHGL